MIDFGAFDAWAEQRMATMSARERVDFYSSTFTQDEDGTWIQHLPKRPKEPNLTPEETTALVAAMLEETRERFKAAWAAVEKQMR